MSSSGVCEIKIHGHDTNALLVQSTNKRDKIPVPGHKNRNVNLSVEPHLEGIHREGDIGPFLSCANGENSGQADARY